MPNLESTDVVFALTGDVRQNSRALKQLRSLRDMGHDILVLSVGSPAGRQEFENGIHIQYLPHPGFTGPRFFWQNHRLFKEESKIRAHVYHASDLYVLPAMSLAARREKGALVYDARELYPHVAATSGKPLIRLFWKAVEGRYIRRADAVFTVSDSIANHIQETYGIRRPAVLHNVPPSRTVRKTDTLRRETGVPSDTTIILHQGQMRTDRGCVQLVRAMQGVRNAQLVFLGNGPLKSLLIEEVTRLHLDARVHFLPPEPPDKLPEVTASADIGVTLLEDTCLNHRYALPNKLFEYCMAGLPVLASDLPEISAIVKRYDIGKVVDSNNYEAITRTLQSMVDDDEARLQWSKHTSSVLHDFNWENESKQLIETYERLLKTRSEHSAAP